MKKALNQVMISALKGCTTVSDIQDTFDKYAVIAPDSRINYLNAAMGDPQTFFSGSTPPVNLRYEVTLRMFLAGTWRLNALYEKAGL